MVKRHKQAPFNAKPQTLEKYQALLNSPGSLEATAPASEETIASLGTSAPKEEEQEISKSKRKKGRRTKDPNRLMDFFQNYWVPTSILIACAIWATKTTHSLNGLETAVGKIQSEFDHYSNNVSIKLEVIQQSLDRFFNNAEEAKDPTKKEFNLFNFSRSNPK